MFGKRKDGTLVRGLDPIGKAIPYFMPHRYDALNMMQETIDVTEMDAYIKREAKEKGYTVVSYFVCTKSPKINVERVTMRVEQGGHDVPKDKIISRYHRSVENGKELKALSDEFYAFDNSLDLNAKMQEELSRE
jgi:predicted ABC-type ATPase